MIAGKTKKRFICGVLFFSIFCMPAYALADTGAATTYSDGDWCKAIVQTKSIYQFDDAVFASGDAEKIMAEVKKQDRYAEYYTAEQYAATMLDLEGKKVAAGIQTSEIDGKVEIVGLIDGSPASISGVKVGDIITHVSGESITGLSYKDAVMKMQERKTPF